MRKLGIASRIMAATLRRSREESALLCTLEVGQLNDSAKKLYEKFGFVVTGVRKKYYHESDEDALLYETGHIPGAVKVDWWNAGASSCDLASKLAESTCLTDSRIILNPTHVNSR